MKRAEAFAWWNALPQAQKDQYFEAKAILGGRAILIEAATWYAERHEVAEKLPARKRRSR
jgi:hypothetical protein